MRVIRHPEPMTPLDVRAIVALRKVRGMSTNAARIADTLLATARRHEAITVRQRFALYSICWRFRRQIPMPLQVKITIALAEAKARTEEFRIDNPEPDQIRSFRTIADGKVSPAESKVNPLDDLFPDTVPS